MGLGKYFVCLMKIISLPSLSLPFFLPFNVSLVPGSNLLPSFLSPVLVSFEKTTFFLVALCVKVRLLLLRLSGTVLFWQERDGRRLIGIAAAVPDFFVQ